MPIDFTGIDTSGIYGGGPSSSSIEYVLQLLEPYGITDVSQIQGMSDAQIQSLINQVVNANTGVNPDPGVYSGSGMNTPATPPVMDTTGLPMGYARDPSGQIITQQQWEARYNPRYSAPPATPASQGGGMDQQSAEAVANAAAGGNYRQNSQGQWYDTTNNDRVWNPNEGMPNDIMMAYMYAENPYLLSGGPVPYTDHLEFKDPITGQARPVPASIQALAADKNTDIIAMEDGYYLSDPVNGTSSKYAPDGSVVYETKVDAQGNYVTSYANGARSLVTKNGWRTDYDATGKVLVHKYQGDPRPSVVDLKNSGDPRARMAAVARHNADITSSMQAKLGQVVGPDGQVNRAAMPQNPGPHTLPQNPIAGTPATGPTTVNAQFGGLGYSGPVPGQPATPASNGIPQNPALGSIDWNDPAWKQKVMPDGSVQTVFEPTPGDPRFDLTGGVDYLHGQSWQDHERDAQAARSSQAGDLQASGMTDYQMRHPIPPDDTPGYGNNPPSTTGVPPATPPATGNVPPGPPATTTPPPVRPPGTIPQGEVRPMPYPGRPTPPAPEAGIGPRDVLTGGGETRNMPGGTRPTSYPSTTGQGIYGPTSVTGNGYQQGGNFVPPPEVATWRDQLLQRYQPQTQSVRPTGWNVEGYGRQQPTNAPSAGGSTYAAPPAPVTPAPTPAPVAPPPVQPPLSITNPTSPGWNTGGTTEALRLTQQPVTQQSELLNKMLIQPPKLAPTGTGWRA